MEITRDVINDLLPVYVAGEASADTRRLVEEFLKNDPEFARLIRDERTLELLNQPVELPPSDEKQALALTKRLIKRQTWFLAFALLFTFLPFAIKIEDGAINFLILQNTPLLAAVYWLIAAGCWFGYFRTRRRLQASGI